MSLILDTAEEEEISEARLSFRRASEEVTILKLTGYFLLAVERKMMLAVHRDYDTLPIELALKRLEELSHEETLEACLAAEFNLRQLLHNWRKYVAERDAKIETYHFRRFCDATEAPMSMKVYAALTRFYCSLPYTEMTESKFDLAVTRLFSTRGSKTSREMTVDRDELVRRLNMLYSGNDKANEDLPESSPEATRAINKIDEFLCEAEFLGSFEDLVESNIFNRYRAFKRQLGKLFFDPHVTAACVECNLVIGNVFARLLAKSNERLGETVASESDFGAMFHDISPNAQEKSADLLEAIHSTQGDVSPVERQVWEWLHLVSEGEEPEEWQDMFEGHEGGALNQDAETAAKSRISHLLYTLSTPQPVALLLQDHIEKNPGLETLHLDTFLAAKDEAGEHSREALGLILWIEEILAGESSEPDGVFDENQAEIASVLSEAKSLADKLRLAIPDADLETQNSLLYASNSLLEARVKLEHAIVRHSKKNLEAMAADDPDGELIDAGDDASQEVAMPGRKKQRRPVSRLLVAATLLSMILSLGLYLSVDYLEAGVIKSNDVEELDAKKLPGGDYIKAAFRHGNTLMVIANISWDRLSEERQQEYLKELLNYPAPIKIANVAVTSIDGKPLGSANREGIQIVSNDEKADFSLR